MHIECIFLIRRNLLCCMIDNALLLHVVIAIVIEVNND